MPATQSFTERTRPIGGRIFLAGTVHPLYMEGEDGHWPGIIYVLSVALSVALSAGLFVALSVALSATLSPILSAEFFYHYT